MYASLELAGSEVAACCCPHSACTQFSLAGASATIPAVRRGPPPAAPRAAAPAKVPLVRGPAKAAPGPTSRASSASLEQLEAAQQEMDVLREQVRHSVLLVLGWCVGGAGRGWLWAALSSSFH